METIWISPLDKPIIRERAHKIISCLEKVGTSTYAGDCLLLKLDENGITVSIFDKLTGKQKQYYEDMPFNYSATHIMRALLKVGYNNPNTLFKK